MENESKPSGRGLSEETIDILDRELDVQRNQVIYRSDAGVSAKTTKIGDRIKLTRLKRKGTSVAISISPDGKREVTPI